VVLLCAIFVFSVPQWLEMWPKIPPERHQEHKGHTEKSLKTPEPLLYY